MGEVIKVGMADWKTCKGDDGVMTVGLGSCVGIAIRDPATGIGGLAHIMLPDSKEIVNKKPVILLKVWAASALPDNESKTW